MPQAPISLTLFRHFSLSFIASGRSLELHPISSHSCWMYVRVARPAFGRLYVGVHRSTSLKSSSLLFQQCPACLVRLTCIDFVMCIWGAFRDVYLGSISCVYLGSISSLIHIWLNNTDILSSRRIDFMVSEGNWLINHPWLINSPFCSLLGHHQGCVYCKSDVAFVCPLLLCKYWTFIIYTSVSL